MGNDPNMSGIVPKILALLANKEARLVDSERCSGILQGCRLGFTLMLNVCKLLRPRRNSGGTEEKLLLSRKTLWRDVRFERDGRGPES